MTRALNGVLDHPDLAKLILRMTFAFMMLLHGIAKLRHGFGVVEGMLTSNGFPASMAYGVLISEILAPVLIAIGLCARLSGIVMAAGMLGAWYLSGTPVFGLKPGTGALAAEHIAVFLIAGVVIALLGSGKYAVRPD